MRFVLATLAALGTGCGGLEGRGKSSAPDQATTTSAANSSSSSASKVSSASETSSASSSCGSSELLCAASCVPPAYRCQSAELACLGCPLLPQDSGSASDAASVDAGGAEACGPGLILCPDACAGGTSCWPGPKCPPPCLK